MKIKSILVAVIIAGSFIFVGCQKEPISNDAGNSSSLSKEMANTEQKSANEQQENFIYTDDGNPIVRGRLHRGRRWTARYNAYLESIGRGSQTVAPCSTSLGMCGIKFFWQNDGYTVYTDIALEPIPGVTRLEFIPQEEVEHARDGDIFFSDEDGRFSLPIEVSKELFGDEESRFITILPGNYIFDVSEEYPFGHVIVNYEFTQEEFVN
jgi:hypothetical protein